MPERISNHQQSCLDMVGDEDLMFLDGHDDAIIGVAERDGGFLVVYDQAKILRKLCRRDGMEWEEAEEFFDFNVAGAWMGEQTPIFLKRLPS